MKTQLTTLAATVLLTLGTLVPATAAHSDYLLEIPTIDGELEEAESALTRLGTIPPEPVRLLLPAVQKIREACARMSATGQDAAGRETAAGGASLLAGMILDSADGRDPALSLLDLYAQGTNKSIKEAKLIGNKERRASDSARASEDMLVGILIGLLKQCSAQKMPAEVTDPLAEALDLAAGLSPHKGNVEFEWKVEEGES